MFKSFPALAALIGTIIGAGILGIPYVVMQSGFPVGMLHLVLIAIAMTLIMLYLGEIALRTKHNHQLPGFAKKYLGQKGKTIMFGAVAFGIYSALIAYIIAEGESLSFLFFGTPRFHVIMALIFWVALSAITYLGIKALKEGETISVILIFALIISISIFFSNKIDVNNLKDVFPGNFFVPFGVILFAFLGFSAIPEVKRILGEHKKPMKNIILSAYAICFIIYAIFTAIVLGYAGSMTPEIATIALGKPFIFLGILTMFGAYLGLSMAMIDTIRFDFNKSRTKSWLWTIFIPIIAYLVLELSGKADFTKVLGIGGVISGGITAVLILFMVKNAKNLGDEVPNYSMPYSRTLTWILIILFAIGAFMEIKNMLF
jgi:amino acid permease